MSSLSVWRSGSWSTIVVLCALMPPPLAARQQVAVPRAAVAGAPEGVIAFTDVNVIPMDTERVLRQQTVLVEAGWITALGSSGSVRVPAGATRIDGGGRYLTPGLADMHVHLDHVAPDSATLERLLPRFLAYGITTVRDMTHMSPAPRNLQFRARAAAGKLLSPRIYTSGQWAPSQYTGRGYEKDGGLDGPAPRLDSVAAYVAAYKARGYDHVKPYLEQRPVLDSLLAAAHRLDVPVAGHLPRPWNDGQPRDTALTKDTAVTLQWALASGTYRSIEHLMGYQRSHGEGQFNLRQLDEPKLPARVAATVRAGVWNSPTVAVGERYRLNAIQWANGRRTKVEGDRKIVQALHTAGAKLLLASDLGMRGWTSSGVVHHELAALRRAGLSSYEALLTGTRNVAQYFGTLDSTGTIAVGKRADLVLLAGNPLEDIRHTREPEGVMLGGRWLDRVTLDGFLSTPLREQNRLGALEVIYREGYEGFNPSLSDSLSAVHLRQLIAMAESLGNAGTHREQPVDALKEVAARLGALREDLVPEQHESYDPAIRVWLREQARQGVQLTVLGVRTLSP